MNVQIKTATATMLNAVERKPSLLSQKAMLAHVAIGGWSARKLDRKISDETNERYEAKQDVGRFNKLLLPKDALEPITKLVSEARAAHYRVTMPWMDDGQRILPAAMYMAYMKEQRELKAKYDAAVRKFVRDYPKLVEEAPARLGKAFRPTDFPHPDSVPGMFYFDIKIMACPDASDFRVDIATEHAEDIRNDIEQRMKQTIEDVMKEPIRRIIAVTEAMVDRLKNYKPATGNRRAENTFRDSLVENVRDLVGLLPSFNLTGDQMLKKITDEMADKLVTHDAEVLRTNATKRREVAAAAEKILAQANMLMA